MLGLNTESEIL